jgi:hypothetical protein
LIEAIFGGEESNNHKLKTRFRTKEHQEKWGQIIAIGWNLKTLNRIRCTKQPKITVKNNPTQLSDNLPISIRFK